MSRHTRVRRAHGRSNVAAMSRLELTVVAHLRVVAQSAAAAGEVYELPGRLLESLGEDETTASDDGVHLGDRQMIPRTTVRMPDLERRIAPQPCRLHPLGVLAFDEARQVLTDDGRIAPRRRRLTGRTSRCRRAEHTRSTGRGRPHDRHRSILGAHHRAIPAVRVEGTARTVSDGTVVRRRRFGSEHTVTGVPSHSGTTVSARA